MPRTRKKDRHLPERVYKKHGAFFYVTHETNKWIRLGTKVSEAVKKYYEIRGYDKPLHVMKDIFDRYMAEIAPAKKPSTYKGNLQQMMPLREAFGHMTPDDITPVHVYQYLDKRAKKGSPIAGNREKALLSHVYTMAIRWGVAAKNPCRDVKRNKETPRNRIVEVEEFNAVYVDAPIMIQVAMMMAYLTALREIDILELELTQIYPDGILVNANKTNKGLFIEMTNALRRVIDLALSVMKVPGRKYLICNRFGKKYTSDGFRTIFTRHMHKCVKEGRLKEKFLFMDLRSMAADAVDLEHAISLLDHSDPAITKRHYRRKVRRVKPVM